MPIYDFVGDRPVHNCYFSQNAMTYMFYYTQWPNIVLLQYHRYH
jgi:hypothetical protein